MRLLTIIKRLLSILRPHHWLKNLLLLFPPFFGGKVMDSSVITAILPAFLSFSFAASCGYIVNDIRDREVDRHHATKKSRPIVRGEVAVVTAFFFALLLYIAAILMASSVSQRFEGMLIIYFFISFLYTIYFKNIVIVDIFFISFGFLIRVLAGGEAFHIPVSSWLFLTVFMVSLVLASGKRLGELVALGEEAHKQRKTLSQYSIPFLEKIIWFFASTALVMYAIYAVERHNNLFYTVPLVAYGFIRYMYIAKEGKGDPTDALLKDWQIIAIGTMWAVSIGVITYR